MPAFLQQPYPFTTDKRRRMLSAAAIAFFVFLFLFVFRPFGLNNVVDGVLFVSFCYGCISLLASLLMTIAVPAMFPALFEEEYWTVGREIVFTTLIILIIAAGNLLFSSMLGYTSLSLKGYFVFIFFTLLIAAIPVTIAVLVKQNVLLRKNLSEAGKLTNQLNNKNRLRDISDPQITIKAENPKDHFMVDPAVVFYIKAAENYVEVFYHHNGIMTKKLIRTTLKGAHENLKSQSRFYRCHRTFLVNLDKVLRVTGNAQGYKLILNEVEEEIPVSRSLNNDIALRLRR